MDVWSSQHVAGVGYSWHDCLWQELDIRDMDVWPSQHMARDGYSCHGCQVATAYGRSYIFMTWISGRHSTRQELDIRDMNVWSLQRTAWFGQAWHRSQVITAHGRSWIFMTWMSRRHRTWQELKTVLVTWMTVVTERDTAGVGYRVNLCCLSHLCSKLLWVSW